MRIYLNWALWPFHYMGRSIFNIYKKTIGLCVPVECKQKCTYVYQLLLLTHKSGYFVFGQSVSVNSSGNSIFLVNKFCPIQYSSSHVGSSPLR